MQINSEIDSYNNYEKKHMLSNQNSSENSVELRLDQLSWEGSNFNAENSHQKDQSKKAKLRGIEMTEVKDKMHKKPMLINHPFTSAQKAIHSPAEREVKLDKWACKNLNFDNTNGVSEATDQEDPQSWFEDRTPVKRINFDIFDNKGSDNGSIADQISLHELNMFESDKESNNNKDLVSKDSNSILDKLKIKHKHIFNINLKENLNDSKAYASPEIRGKNKGRASSRIFDYDLCNRSRSYDYNENEWQATPSKRNTKSHK